MDVREERFSRKILGFAVALMVSLSLRGKVAYAQTPTCVGASLGDYVANVLDALGGADHVDNVHFLSPVFNATNTYFEEFAGAFNAQLELRHYNLGYFDYIAANAYNMGNQRIVTQPDGYAQSWAARIQNSPIGGHGVILTEIGWYPHDEANGPTEERLQALAEEISAFSSGGIYGGLIFNAFGYNPGGEDRDFAGQDVTEEIGGLCSSVGGCRNANVGANSAVYYYNAPNFYNQAHDANLRFTLEIKGSYDSTLQGVLDAHGRSPPLVPIIRLGVQDDGGGMEDPQALADFITRLAEDTNKLVYVILGPNEPLTECWATERDCGCDLDVDDLADEPRIIHGFVKGSQTIQEPSSRAPGLASEITAYPAENVAVCVYQGYNKVGPLKLRETFGMDIKGFSGGTTTNKHGYYEVDSSWIKWESGQDIWSYQPSRSRPYNIIAFFGNGKKLLDIYMAAVDYTLNDYELVLADRYNRAYRLATGGELSKRKAIPPLDITVNTGRNAEVGDFCDEPEEIAWYGNTMRPNPSYGIHCGDPDNEISYCPRQVVYGPRYSSINFGSCLVGGAKGITSNNDFMARHTLDWGTNTSNLGEHPDSVHEVELPAAPTDGSNKGILSGEGRLGMGVFHWVETFARYQDWVGTIWEQLRPGSAFGGNVPDCEYYREANRAVNSNESPRNSLKNRGSILTLAAPSSYLDIPGLDPENPVGNPTSQAYRYSVSDMNRNVCRNSETGEVMQLRQIQPPQSWIHPYYRCNPGDPTRLIEWGAYTEPFTCQYVLPVEYFPYEILHEIYNQNSSIRYTSKVIDDSYTSGRGFGNPQRIRFDVKEAGVDVEGNKLPFYEEPCITNPNVMCKTGPEHLAKAMDGGGNEYYNNTNHTLTMVGLPGMTNFEAEDPNDPEAVAAALAATALAEIPPANFMRRAGEDYTVTYSRHELDLKTGRDTFLRIGVPLRLCMFSKWLDPHHIDPMIWPNPESGVNPRGQYLSMFDFAKEDVVHQYTDDGIDETNDDLIIYEDCVNGVNCLAGDYGNAEKFEPGRYYYRDHTSLPGRLVQIISNFTTYLHNWWNQAYNEEGEWLHPGCVNRRNVAGECTHCTTGCDCDQADCDIVCDDDGTNCRCRRPPQWEYDYTCEAGNGGGQVTGEGRLELINIHSGFGHYGLLQGFLSPLEVDSVMHEVKSVYVPDSFASWQVGALKMEEAYGGNEHSLTEASHAGDLTKQIVRRPYHDTF